MLTIPYFTFLILSNFRFCSYILQPRGFSMGQGHYSTYTCQSGIPEATLQDLPQFSAILSPSSRFYIFKFILLSRFFTLKQAKVICNYVSSLSSLCSLYHIPCDSQHPSIGSFLHSISIMSLFRPTPNGVFDIPTLHVSRACDLLDDPTLYRAIFLTTF